MSGDEGGDSANSYPVMGWIAELTPHLLVGPCPRSSDDIGYLIRNKRVDQFIIVSPKAESRDAYQGFFTDAAGREPILPHPRIDRFPFDIAEYVSKGRLKEEQQRHKAAYYVTHALKIAKLMKAHPERVLYVHDRTGFMNEAYIAFAVWVLACPDSKTMLPADPLVWIKEKMYEALFDDDSDNKELLMAVWAEARSILRAQQIFGGASNIKRAKK